MAGVEVTEEDTEDRNNWRWKIRCGDPYREKPKGEEEVVLTHCCIALTSACPHYCSSAGDRRYILLR